jgi:hypothetical protein
LYCGEFQVHHVFSTINLVVQSVGSFCAYLTNIGGHQIQVDAFNDWGFRSLTANPWASRSAPSAWDMVFNGAPFGIPGSLLPNTQWGPGHRMRFWYHWTEPSPCQDCQN